MNQPSPVPQPLALMVDSASRRRRWDIFCTVIDNYGDIGVCWRLARQLAMDFGLAVRLWVDDLTSFRRLCPNLDETLAEQVQAGVRIGRWDEQSRYEAAADVVIEAFACELPETYLALMRTAPIPPIWLNLEYLSAEDWVRDCHGLASVHPRLGLRKYFFFPGFSMGTGGVLGEHGLLARRRAFQTEPDNRTDFLDRLGVEIPADARLISLFAYENPSLPSLLAAMAGSVLPVFCLVPEGRILPEVLAFFGVDSGAPGMVFRRGALSVRILPFLAQDDYDRLLWCCDFNLVRGEDSFVRAQWAGRPFLWHIYRQEELAHLVKLDAFLALYRGYWPEAVGEALMRANQAWNRGESMTEHWPALAALLNEPSEAPEHWCAHLESLGDLASNLVQFCADRV